MLPLNIIYVLVFTIQVKSAAIGTFSEWNPWSQCLATCGPSIRFRFRECNQEPCASEAKREIESCQERLSCIGPWTTEAEPTTKPEPTTEVEVPTEPSVNGLLLMHAEGVTGPAVDLAFLLDESISVSEHYVTLGKFFVHQFLQRSISTYDIRYALCSFSSKFNIVFDYGELDESGMIHAVDAIRYDGGTTDVTYAIEQLKTGVLRGVRPGATSIVVLISDGYFDKDPGALSDVKTFAVAIGDNVNEEILSHFADGAVFRIEFDSDVRATVSDMLSAM